MLNILHRVEEIVIEASTLWGKQPLDIKLKSVKEDLVTSTDLEVQSFLNVELTKIIEDSVVFGEENHNNTIREHTWVVDPIDGTMNFVRRIPFSAISVALLKEGEIVLGVVYNPFTHELFSALKNHGAFLNHEPIHVSTRPFGESLFCTALSLYQKKYAPVCIDIMKSVYDDCSDIRRFGSCALELCYLACGRIDLFFEIRVFFWDYAAAGIILSEAGGYILSGSNTLAEEGKAISLIAGNSNENFQKLKSIVDRKLNKMKKTEMKQFIHVKPRKDSLKTAKDYDLKTIYQNAHSELTLQQTKRDQIIALYLTLASFLVPFSYSIESFNGEVRSALFYILFAIGFILSIIIIRYKVYKEVYWASCQTISQLFNFDNDKIDKHLIQSLFYEVIRLKNPAKHGIIKGVAKNFFSAETLLFEIHVIITAITLFMATMLSTTSFLAAILAVLCFVIVIHILYFQAFFRVFSVNRTHLDKDFNYAFSKAWFLHFYVNCEFE